MVSQLSLYKDFQINVVGMYALYTADNFSYLKNLTPNTVTSARVLKISSKVPSLMHKLYPKGYIGKGSSRADGFFDATDE